MDPPARGYGSVSYQRDALLGGEMFFPPSAPERKDEKAAREDAAKAICADCDVSGECLDYALSIQEPHGIWGGLNELERRAGLNSASWRS